MNRLRYFWWRHTHFHREWWVPLCAWSQTGMLHPYYIGSNLWSRHTCDSAICKRREINPLRLLVYRIVYHLKYGD